MTAPLEPIRDLDALLARTPARVLVGRAGPAYRTITQLHLRLDHAAARDAVRAELDPRLLEGLGLFEVTTLARSKDEYLLRPDLGRRLSDTAKANLRERCPRGCDLQIVVGDGLSATAVAAQVPGLLPLLVAGAEGVDWTVGRSFAVRHCRVGVLNDVGEILDPTVVVLLIGERPGLATADSLSAYLAFEPRPGDTDAKRNLISNIHARGVGIEEAAERIVALARALRRAGASGVAVKEEWSPARPAIDSSHEPEA